MECTDTCAKVGTKENGRRGGEKEKGSLSWREGVCTKALSTIHAERDMESRSLKTLQSTLVNSIMMSDMVLELFNFQTPVFSRVNGKMGNMILTYIILIFCLRLQVYGSFTWRDSSDYNGFWKGGHMEGEGTYSSNEEIITGNWKNSVLHGEGIKKLANGDTYTGIWVNGMLQGEGSYQASSGNYNGSFQNNKENGIGRKEFSDETVYQGSWKDGVFSGKGFTFFS